MQLASLNPWKTKMGEFSIRKEMIETGREIEQGSTRADKSFITGFNKSSTRGGCWILCPGKFS